MAEKRDGVADGWILFEGWCKRNGGTPIRGSSSADHVCFKGPLPDDTIDPGDDGTVDVAFPGGGRLSQLEQDRLELKLRAAKLRLYEAELEFNITSELVNTVLKKTKKKKKK